MAHQQYHFEEMRRGFAQMDKRLTNLENDMCDVKKDITSMKGDIHELNQWSVQADVKMEILTDDLMK
jgi:peptidoglycan hydrolase CwlO-like protein